MAEPRTIRSPKENIAEDEILIIQEAQTKIKEIIVIADTTNEPRATTVKKVAGVINNALVRLPEQRQDTARQALISSWQRWDAFYTNARKVANTALLAQVQKLAKTRPQIFIANKTYTIDLNAWAKATSSAEQQTLVERFRPFLTEDRRGAAMVEQYDKRVKERIKFLASDPATAQPKDRNGKALNLRNVVESQVRYEANQQDIKTLANEGVDLVWTSSHADASSRCSPYQGRLYSLTGKSGMIDGERYTPLDEATLGPNKDGNGIINGYNCRHRLIEYQPKSKAPKEYDSKTIRKENAINNRQRQYERDIRNLKIEERLARESGQTAYASELRETWQDKRDKYIEFSQQNVRPYYLWRTRILEEEV